MPPLRRKSPPTVVVADTLWLYVEPVSSSNLPAVVTVFDEFCVSVPACTVMLLTLIVEVMVTVFPVVLMTTSSAACGTVPPQPLQLAVFVALQLPPAPVHVHVLPACASWT